MVIRLAEYPVSTEKPKQVLRLPEGAVVTRLVASGASLKLQAFSDTDSRDGVGFSVWLVKDGESTNRIRDEWSVGSATLGGVVYHAYAQPLDVTGEVEDFSPGYAHTSWSNAVAYSLGDLVPHNGSLYVCRIAQNPVRPGNTPLEPGTDGGVNAWHALVEAPTITWETGTAHYDGASALYVAYGADGAWEVTKATGSNILSTGTQAGTMPTTLTSLQSLSYS